MTTISVLLIGCVLVGVIIYAEDLTNKLARERIHRQEADDKLARERIYRIIETNVAWKRRRQE